MPTSLELQSPIIWNALLSSTNIPNKNESIAFLQECGILHKPRFCDNGHEMKLNDENDTWKCRRPGCHLQKQLKSDTWLNGEQTPYSNVIRFIYYWCKDMATVTLCEKELSMKEGAVIRWHNYLAEVCATDVLATTKRIGGCGMTVEIDEGLFVRRNRYSRSVAKEICIYGGICRETKESFMVEVKEKNAETLEKALEKWVKPGTTIIGDLLEELSKKIKKEDRAKYRHLTCNNSYMFIVSSALLKKELVEGSWCSAKKKYIPNLYGMVKTMNRSYNTKQYFCQFLWRSKLKLDYLDPFNTILQQIADYFGPDAKV